MKKNLLLILVVCIIIFVFKYNKNCSIEKFSEVCWSLQSSYAKDILNQNKKLITSFGLNNFINKIIEPLVKPQIIDRKLTLEKYFSNIKIPLNKVDQATILIKNIVDNNCLISTLNEFDIKKTNSLFDVVSIWNMNNLINSMICVIDDKKVIDKEFSIEEGGLKLLNYAPFQDAYESLLKIIKRKKIPTDIPIKKLPKDFFDILENGQGEYPGYVELKRYLDSKKYRPSVRIYIRNLQKEEP